jgi:hypothetical protein
VTLANNAHKQKAIMRFMGVYYQKKFML